jgi:hypothetical protein
MTAIQRALRNRRAAERAAKIRAEHSQPVTRTDDKESFRHGRDTDLMPVPQSKPSQDSQTCLQLETTVVHENGRAQWALCYPNGGDIVAELSPHLSEEEQEFIAKLIARTFGGD